MRCVTEKRIHVSHSDGTGEYMDVPCGNCYACRHSKTNMWIDRLEMEMRTSPHPVYFITLTYDEEHVPRNSDGDRVLNIRDVQLYLKRIRKAAAPQRFRYCYLGEYGGRTFRPHYHLILYGFQGNVSEARKFLKMYWNNGNIRVDYVNSNRLAYVASFHINSFVWPLGRTKPFVQYSRKPGIGYGYLEDYNLVKSHLHANMPDCTYVNLRGQRRILPKYHRDKLWPDGFPLPFTRKPLTEFLGEKFPEMSFFDAVAYVSDIYEKRLNYQVKKHGKYIQSED